MDIKLYRSKTRNDSNFNGGYEDVSSEVISGQYNNLFPDVSPSERSSGYTRYRKVFVHAVTQTLSECYLGIYHRSTAGDYFRLHASSAAQTQGALLGLSSHKWYGTGKVIQSISAGGTFAKVNFDGSLPDLAVNDHVLLNEGNTNELFTISSFTASGVSATVYFNETVQHSYSTNAELSHLLSLGSIAPSFTNWSESSSQGTYDEVNYPPTLYLVGTVEDNWTLTFSGATIYSCSGLTSGNVGTGTTSSDFSPSNPTGGTYFTILASGWGGTWQSGDTITFKTHPASKPAWVKEVIPANTPATISNETPLVVIFA